jgi:hypothetical protein
LAFIDGLVAATREEGLCQCKPEEQHGNGSHDEQNDIANLQHLPVTLQGFFQKVHRSPLHDAISPAIKQVDDDRAAGAGNAGHDKRPHRE